MSTGPDPLEIEAALDRITGGDPRATADLTVLLYKDLRRIARSQLGRVAPGGTLQATALVHEAFLRLRRSDDAGWGGRDHFLGAAARAMRRIVVEHARAKLAIKRGSGMRVDESLDQFEIELGAPTEDLLALDEALDELERRHPRQARTVMLRYFAGLEEAVIADVLEVSVRTVRRDWKLAKVFIARRLLAGDAAGSGAADGAAQPDAPERSELPETTKPTAHREPEA